jgi:dTDP-L-rhamnose 4-epimerase
MSKLVLVTGGSGFIGSHLISQLLASGFAIRILDNLSPQIHGEVPNGLDWLGQNNIDFVRGSVTLRSDLERALHGVSYIIHLAAETGTGQSMYEISRYNDVNTQGTALLLDILANSPASSVRRIVLASSRSIYGEGAYVCSTCGDQAGRIFPESRPAPQLAAHRWEPICKRCGGDLNVVATHEEDRVRPASIYAATKFAQEDLVRVACEALGIGYTILRLQNVYGEGQSLKNPYTGILSIFSTRVRRGLQLTAFEDGLESRDFVHVSDVAQAMLLSLTALKSPNTVINVGSGLATSVLDVAARLSEALGHTPDIRVTAEYRLGDIRHNVADITRLREVLGYTPQVSLHDGLRRFCDWVLTQPLPDDLLDRANSELKARKLMG